jgi:hypothetical protein
VTSCETYRTLIAALIAANLSGCAASDESAARFLVAPGQYVIYSCVQIAEAAQANAVRQRELEKLMAKAGTDSAGRFVSGLAYRPEYVQLRGDMTELRKEAASKHCKFTPGVDVPGGRASDQVVR